MQPAEKLHARNYCANRTTKSANPGRYVPLTPLTLPREERESSLSHRRRLIIGFETSACTQLRNAICIEGPGVVRWTRCAQEVERNTRGRKERLRRKHRPKIGKRGQSSSLVHYRILQKTFERLFHFCECRVRASGNESTNCTPRVCKSVHNTGGE